MSERRAVPAERGPRLDGLRVLVTGASGFLGSRLADRLQRDGVQVHAVSRAPRGDDPPGVQWWQATFNDVDSARRLLERIRPDVIYHMSGHVTADPSLNAVTPTFHSLLAHAVHLLTAATEVGCRRFVLPGSMTEPAPGQVDTPPGSPYVAAKWAASAYGRMFHALYGTPVVIVRPSMTYGPGQAETKLIPSVILSLLRGRPPKLTNGLLRADWTYIDDMIDGLLAAACAPGVEGLTIDLGSGSLVSVRELVRTLTDRMGSTVEPAFGVLPDRPLEAVRAADVRHARATLGWEAVTPLDAGLAATIEWYAARDRRRARARDNARQCARRDLVPRGERT